MSAPAVYRIEKDRLLLCPHDDDDARGLVMLWEPPSPNQTYIMGIDPTVGITGWDRRLRREEDSKTDNGAIEIIRMGRADQPDVQVAEFAAPVDAEELAVYANFMGRLYGGNNESGQCLCIIEVWPGPGMVTQRVMYSELGYTNQYAWVFWDRAQLVASNKMGWYSSRSSVRDLWIRTSRHIHQNRLVIRSLPLLEEMRNCEMDMDKMTARGAYGQHDDRVRAVQMAVFAAHEWSAQSGHHQEQKVETTAEPVDWQQSDISAEGQMEAWEDRYGELSGS